ncbi:hypothetical protein [Polaromonas hydrogenivorans]|uniref:Uncharacterized protein n=1 Tax=Polaromonas hydrogenivorans TaxID=335476 RepID=A0AAU7LTY2_9BURK
MTRQQRVPNAGQQSLATGHTTGMAGFVHYFGGQQKSPGGSSSCKRFHVNLTKRDIFRQSADDFSDFEHTVFQDGTFLPK